MVTPARKLPARPGGFAAEYERIAEEHYGRIVRYLARVSGDPELAADLTQEVFLRLHRKGAAPDAPGAWLVTVANNLLRNERSKRNRRRELLTLQRGRAVHSRDAPPPDRAAEGEGPRVRTALDRLSPRDRELLLLLAEGFSYRDMAAALELNEASVGTFLSRAKAAFRRSYEETTHAP